MFSPSNKIYREVGRAKDLSTPLISEKNNNYYRIRYSIKYLHNGEEVSLHFYQKLLHNISNLIILA
jgi:hypothetical protein